MDPDDIFDYKPLKRQKKSVSPGNIVNIIPNERISADLKNAHSLSNEEETPIVKVEATPETSNISSTENNGSLTYCPICQISSDIFFLNVRNIKKWSDHLSTCFDKFPKKILKECPRGMSCDVKSIDHYRKFQHSSLASLRGNVLLYNYSSMVLENDEKKYSMSKEFLNERNDKETNPVSLPISEGTPVKSDNISFTNSYNSLLFQQSHAKGKKIDVEAFKIFSSQPSPRNAAKSPAKSTPRKKRTTKLSDQFITPKKGVTKSPAKSTPRKRGASKLSDPFKTPQKGITKSPAKSILKGSLSSKSPLLKDFTQQTFMYDPNKKAMVLTPEKSPTLSPVSRNLMQQTLMYNSTKKALMLTPQKSQRTPLNDTTEKSESLSKWESLSIRKANPSSNNSRLLSALTKEDSLSCSSTESSPNVQRKKLQSRIALNIGDSDAGPSDILVPSKHPQLSDSSQCKSLSKPKSDKSYVTVLFVSSDSENECDVQTKTSHTQSSRKVSNFEGNSLSTQPADNLDLSSKSESLSIRKANASGNNSHQLSALTKENSLSCNNIERSSNIQRKKFQSRIALNIGDSYAGPSDILVPSERTQLSDSSLCKLKSDKSDVIVLFVSSNSEDECDVQKEMSCSQSSKKSSDSKGNLLSSISQSSEDSSKKANSFSTYESDHTTSNSCSIKSEYYFSDDDLNLPLMPEEINPSTNAVEVKNNLFSKSSPLLSLPLKPPVCSSSKKASENVSSLSTNQMRLAPIFIRKPRDKQSKVSTNVKSNKTKSKPIVPSNPAHENETHFSVEENPRQPVMELEQFKNMFAKKSSPKNCLTTFKSEQLPQVMPEVQFVTPDSFTSCPFYKKIPDTAITVDAFKYGLIPGCRAYFLSHFHYDHYQGITKDFRQPIYCSQVTANLLKVIIGIASEYIRPLPLYCPVMIEGVNVTLLDANHCPGAILMLFKTKYNKVILHTGDFRADSIMEEYAALKNIKIHQLFLDTTYCNESYAFPSQKDILDLSVSLAMLAVKENSKTLIVVGAYTIGKEKVFLEIAKAIKSKIGVTKSKKKILDCEENSHLDRLVSLNLNECQVHVVKMNLLTYKNLSEHLLRYKNKFDRIIAFKPTGWTHSDKSNTLFDITPSIKSDNIILYGLPYSEHSSFLELKRFVQFVQPDKIIPTVNNGRPSARKAMDEIFKSWLSRKPTVMNNFFPSVNKS